MYLHVIYIWYVIMQIMHNYKHYALKYAYSLKLSLTL